MHRHQRSNAAIKGGGVLILTSGRHAKKKGLNKKSAETLAGGGGCCPVEKPLFLRPGRCDATPSHCYTRIFLSALPNTHPRQSLTERGCLLIRWSERTPSYKANSTQEQNIFAKQ